MASVTLSNPTGYSNAPHAQLPLRSQTINYLFPETSHPVHSPMPLMVNTDLITGIYYNILFPEERQNKAKPALMSYLWNTLDGQTPNFLTAAQFDTLNSYAIKTAPRKAFSQLLADYTLEEVRKGKPIQEAMCLAQQKLELNHFPAYRKVIAQSTQLQNREKTGSPTYQRFAILIEALESCLNKFETVLGHDKRTIEEEFKKGREAGILLLEKSNKRIINEETADRESILERFENRLNVIEQAVNNVLDKTPNAATFLAFQEATPDAVVEMKERWKNRKFTWISFNNISGEETKIKSKEDIFGESTAFTSTLALSPALKVQRVALGSLPSPSGSTRRILGVEVLNTKTSRPLAIFTAHTDHLVLNTLYHDTVVGIHQFVTAFLQKAPNMPRVFGGDLNAFETSGAAEFIHELRQGPFEGGQDYREGDAFYVPKPIANSTYIGKESDRFKALFIEGKLTSNSLDHILTNHVKVVVGTRNDAVYDVDGRLVDHYTQPKIYQERLAGRRTASDHFMNVIVFRV